MLKIDSKVINVIRKIRKAVEEEKISLDDFPLNDIESLIKNTLGGDLWKAIGSKTQDSFQMVSEKYMVLFRHCIEKKDIQGCLALLELYENQYRCFYTALGSDEQIFREKNYRIVILNIGHAFAKVQYWMHEKRQGGWNGDSNFFAQGKGVVYTCLLGGNDKLYQPEYRNVYWDYICITDKEELWGTRQGTWECRKPEFHEDEKKSMLFYKYKIKPYEFLSEYDYSIWIDPQMQIIGELEKFYKIYGKNASFLSFTSYGSDDMYDIYNTSLAEDDDNIAYRLKMHQSRKEGYPEHYGLISSRLMIRNHRDEQLRAVMEEWWKEAAECRSMREFAFNYAAWKKDFKFAVSDLFVENNPYIKSTALDLEVEIVE